MEENKQTAEVGNNVKAIKSFFENGPNGKKVMMIEMKALSAHERAELGTMCLKALGQ